MESAVLDVGLFRRSLVESDNAAGAVAKSTQIFLEVKGGSRRSRACGTPKNKSN